MLRKFPKYKILLDENMHPRRSFPLLNHNFDVKHIAKDLKKSGLKDPQVYKEAARLQRILVTFNGDDFEQMAGKSADTGIIAISGNLSVIQIDKKLTAFLHKAKPSDLFRKYNYISGES